MPAPAVIPAPIANLNVVAIKKLVVEFLAGQSRSNRAASRSSVFEGMSSLI